MDSQVDTRQRKRAFLICVQFVLGLATNLSFSARTCDRWHVPILNLLKFGLKLARELLHLWHPVYANFSDLLWLAPTNQES